MEFAIIINVLLQQETVKCLSLPTVCGHLYSLDSIQQKWHLSGMYSKLPTILKPKYVFILYVLSHFTLPKHYFKLYLKKSATNCMIEDIFSATLSRTKTV